MANQDDIDNGDRGSKSARLESEAHDPSDDLRRVGPTICVSESHRSVITRPHSLCLSETGLDASDVEDEHTGDGNVDDGSLRG